MALELRRGSARLEGAEPYYVFLVMEDFTVDLMGTENLREGMRARKSKGDDVFRCGWT